MTPNFLHTVGVAGAGLGKLVTDRLLGIRSRNTPRYTWLYRSLEAQSTESGCPFRADGEINIVSFDIVKAVAFGGDAQSMTQIHVGIV